MDTDFKPNKESPSLNNLNVQGESENKERSFEEAYNLEGEKVALLFFHQKFDESYECDRNYVKEDCEKLRKCFASLGFTTREFHDYDEVNVIQEIRNACVFLNIRCLLIYMSSRGENNVIHAKDGFYSTNKIIDPIKDSVFLIGIPKIIILQTSKEWNPMELDGGAMSTQSIPMRKIPTHADLMIVKVNAADRHSVLSQKATSSLFVGIFTELLETHGGKLDLKNILVLTNGLYTKIRRSMGDVESRKDFVRFTDTHRKLLYFNK